MRIFLMILCSLFFAGCIDTTFFAPLTSEYRKKKKAVDEYGGLYILDLELYNEMKENERKIDEARKKLSKLAEENNWTDEEFKEYVEKNGFPMHMPRILSNGCKYVNDFCLGSCEDENVKKAKEKLREFIKPTAGSGIRYGVRYHARCPDGKTIVITMRVHARYYGTNYGLYGNENNGIHFSEPSEINIRPETRKIFHLIDGEFKKVVDEKW